MASLVVYPDPDPETNTVDGVVKRDTLVEAFSTVRSGAGTSADDSSSSLNIQIAANPASDYDRIYRAPLLFLTSSIPDDATIDSATLEIYITGKSDNLATAQSISLVKPTPASNTTLVASDYNVANWDMTKQATDVTIASITLNAYNTWTLNATGLGNISKTGVTKLGLVLSGDQSNTDPGWVANADASITFQCAETTGTSQDPKLTVNYTIATTTSTTTSTSTTSTSSSTTKTDTTTTTSTTSTSTSTTSTSTTSTSSSTTSTSSSTTSTSSSTTSTSSTTTFPLGIAVDNV